MAPHDVLVAQLLAENRHLRQTVEFLNAQGPGRPQAGAPRESDGPRGREIEETYRILADASLPGLLLIQEGRLVFANRTAADIMGRTVSELLTTTLEQLLTFIHPEDRTLVRRRYEDRLQGRPAPSRYEIRAPGRDGRLCWIEVHARLVEYRGRPATQVTLLDITAHKQTEQTLRETESRLQDIAASIPGAVYQFQVRADNSWEILFMNESAAELFEKPAGELTDMQSLLGCLCPADVETLSTSIEESRQTLRPWVCEFRILTAGGRTKWLRNASRPRRCPEGSILWSGVLLDITERKHAEEVLREGEERLRRSQELLQQTFMSLRDAVFIIDAHTARITQCNPAAAEIFGYDLQEIVGRTTEFLHVNAGTLAEFRWHLSRAMEEKEFLFLPAFAMRRKDGSVFPTEHSVAPIRDDRGRRTGWVSVVRDITDRQRADEVSKLSRSILELSNRSTSKRLMLQQTVAEIQAFTGCQAVGIRLLDQDGNIPYEAYVGFGQDFDERESPLSIRSGRCRCIDVVKGTIDPALPFYTPGGSFYVNGMTRFRATVPEADQGQTRHVCHQAGYESVALIPLRCGGDILGLIHVADAREDRVALHVVQALEMVGVQLGVSIRRVLTEDSLRESEAGLAAAQRLAHLGSWQWDLVRDTARWSEETFRIFGLAGKPLRQHRAGFLSRIVPEDRQRVDQALAEAVRGARDYDLDYRIRRPDGGERVIHAQAQVLRGSEGRPIEMHGTVEDITERKQAQERLQVHQQRLRELASELSLAEERERRRIATALHDHTCQNLVLARMKLDELQASVSPGPAQVLHGICGVLKETIDGVRELTFDLSSPTLYKFGLEAALEELLEDKCRAREGLRCAFVDDQASKPLTEDVRVLLFQSVRELLVNVLKHAQAHQVTLDIRRVEDRIRIAVTDDGIGFDRAEVLSRPARQRGFGLFSIKERLDCIGGDLEIESQPGTGSRFTLAAPLKVDAHACGRKQDVGANSARG